MRDCKYLRPVFSVFSVYDRVRKSVEVVHPHPLFAVRAKLLIENEQVSDTLVLGQESMSHDTACMRGVVHRSISKLNFGLGMDPVAQASLARTRANASSPGTIAVRPAFTSS